MINKECYAIVTAPYFNYSRGLGIMPAGTLVRLRYDWYFDVFQYGTTTISSLTTGDSWSFKNDSKIWNSTKEKLVLDIIQPILNNRLIKLIFDV